jgi:hypothetical protein
MLRSILKAAAFLIGLGLGEGSAQNATTLIANANQGIVSGNLSMFEPPAAQRIAGQLGTPAGYVVYQRMAALGPVVNVSAVSTVPLPNGMMVHARATHQNGVSDWTLGYSYVTQRIAFGMFNGFPSGAATGGSVQQPTPTTISTPPPPSTSDACTKYPTLC